MESIFGGLMNFAAVLCSWYGAIIHTWGIPYSYPVIVGSCFLAALLCVSGFLAADIAENRGYNPCQHMLYGFLLPGIYPLLILKNLKNKFLEAEREKIEKEKMEESKPKITVKKEGIQFVEQTNTPQPQTCVHAVPESFGNGNFNQPVIDPDAEINAKYLTYLARNSNGTAAGPYIFVLKDGSSFTVLRIINPMENAVTLELPAKNNDSAAENVRLPYSRIQTVKKAE